MRKRVFTFLIPIVLTTGCIQNEVSKNESQSTNITNTVVDSSEIYKQEAIELLDEVNGTMRKAIKGEVSQEFTNKEINPKMERFFNLMKKMSPSDTLDVYNYRIQEINKLIDLQIEQDKH